MRRASLTLVYRTLPETFARRFAGSTATAEVEVGVHLPHSLKTYLCRSLWVENESQFQGLSSYDIWVHISIFKQRESHMIYGMDDRILVAGCSVAIPHHANAKNYFFVRYNDYWPIDLATCLRDLQSSLAYDVPWRTVRIPFLFQFFGRRYDRWMTRKQRILFIGVRLGDTSWGAGSAKFRWDDENLRHSRCGSLQWPEVRQ